MPRVTDVLYYQFGSERGDPDAYERGMERGRHVHKAIELFEKGVLDNDSLDERIRPWLRCWQAFRRVSTFRPFNDFVEVDVHHGPPDEFSGRIDAYGSMPISHKRVIVDAKTGAERESDEIQLAAYFEAWLETFPKMPLDQAFCVYLRPESKTLFHLGKVLTRREQKRIYRSRFLPGLREVIEADKGEAI